MAEFNGSLYARVSQGGVYRSTDGGASWVYAGVPGDLGTIVYSMASDGTTLYAGTRSGGVFRLKSDDSWEPLNTGLTNTSMNALAIHGGTLYAGNTHGVLQLNGGA